MDVSKLVTVESEQHRLQPAAGAAYLKLKEAAAKEGLSIWLASAYRDYDYQRLIFLGQISMPINDEDINEQLKIFSIPGYSKHHTGYTIDIAEGNFVWQEFSKSASYEWISTNNYENAKKHGWIPSYPLDGGNQGPRTGILGIRLCWRRCLKELTIPHSTPFRENQLMTGKITKLGLVVVCGEEAFFQKCLPDQQR